MSESATYRILIVEDEPAIQEMLQLNLDLEGYETVLAKDGAAALEALRNQRFDLALLDVMLPEVDGFTVCKTIRLEGNKTPVIFLTAKNSSTDRVEGLKIGGDDYLVKPFNLEELLLRVQKLIKRGGEGQATLADLDTYSFGGNSINFKTYNFTTHSGESGSITKKEAMLLQLLIRKKGEVVSREEILDSIWGYNVFPSTRTIDNYILAFRKNFEKNPKDSQHFHSVRGVGYKFES